MFVYSLRASTLKFFAVVCVALTALITMITFIPSYDGGELGYITTGKEEKINYDKIKTEQDRVEFLSQFGWSVGAAPVEVAEITVPSEFDKIFTGYNEIQKRQGLDLSKYQNKKVTRYTSKVENYKTEGEVYANLFIFRGKIVACDISSASPDGFVIPLTKTEKANLK